MTAARPLGRQLASAVASTSRLSLRDVASTQTRSSLRCYAHGESQQPHKRAFSASARAAIGQPNQDYPGQDRNRASPARVHRANTSAASSGGPDLDPVTNVPRNASTEAFQEEARSGAESLAQIARDVADSRRAAAAGPAMSQPQQAAVAQQDQAANLQSLLVPSGYSTTHLALRTDPLLEAFVNNLMKDGKKARAQRFILDMLNYLAQTLHADPMPALRAAIKTASPLARMQTRKQGGKSIATPMALREEQGRRRAIIAIIEASGKRSDRSISIRLAKEIIAILEGSSSVIAKKEEIHRMAMVNRGNMSVRI